MLGALGLGMLALYSPTTWAQISVDAPEVAAGETFVLQYTDSQSPRDWVGIYSEGELKDNCIPSPNAVVAYLLPEATGNFTLSTAALELAPGTYQLQMFKDYTYCHQGEPATLTVLEAVDLPPIETPGLSIEKESFTENELISVEQLLNSGSEYDWIGIYAEGGLKPNCQAQPDYVTWLYANGGTEKIYFPPQSPGTYTIQLFEDASYCHLGQALTFTVTADPDNPPAQLPAVANIFRPTQEHFTVPEAEVKIQGLTRASLICYSVNGVIPAWKGGQCYGEGVKRLAAPAASEVLTLDCGGETGPAVERPLNILFNWTGRPLYRADAQYQLNCDIPPEPDPIEEPPIEEDPVEEVPDEENPIEEDPIEEEPPLEEDPIEEVTPVIESDKLTYLLGEPITISYTGGSGNATDWIAIFPAGALNISCEETQNYIASANTDGIGGSVIFENIAAGDYQAQLFEDATYCHLGESIAFSVEAPEIEDQCPNDPDKVEPGECGCGIPENTCDLNQNAVIVNPYEYVDWNSWQQYKANYHTHTKESDGDHSPAEVIDAYYAAGYKILSITDHDTITWPWTDWDRDPTELGMLAVRGDEFSRSHHVNGFFGFTRERANHSNAIQDIQAVQDAGGTALCHFNHPLRYNSADDWDWYIPWYKQYPACVGIEAINRVTHAHELWDNINENLFLDNGQLVWGYANDDMHDSSELFRSFQFMLMPELTTPALNMSKITGAFYFCHERGGSGEALVPKLANITVDNQVQTITLTPAAQDYESIRWVGPGSQEVGNGLVFDFSNYPENSFVRAELHGESGSCYTQPFGIGIADNNPEDDAQTPDALAR